MTCQATKIKVDLLVNSAGIIRESFGKKIKLETYFTSYTRITFKWIRDLNVRN